ncbi:MAG: transglutaminase-like domain-containing protein [Candidatus Bathyarchaeota archaeon]|nr:transglutaminase-like domain-containing protein [Candidatus Bathyarchaeota archaeon]
MRKLHQIIAIILIVFSVILSVLAVYVLYLQPMAYENYYLEIMNNCNDPSKKVIVRSWFIRDYNFTEICDWVRGNLDFVPFNESFPQEQRHTDPLEIKEFGKGRCGEFSILYVAACLAHGYECRLVVAADCSGLVWTGKHAWAEVKFMGEWIHVDPSERRWNEPQMYKQWSWGENIGSKVRIFAFEECRAEEVTKKYL